MSPTVTTMTIDFQDLYVASDKRLAAAFLGREKATEADARLIFADMFNKLTAKRQSFKVTAPALWNLNLDDRDAAAIAAARANGAGDEVACFDSAVAYLAARFRRLGSIAIAARSGRGTFTGGQQINARAWKEGQPTL